ncbi:glycosyltransferase 87 family protein [Micromonospora zhanjiangensis]|uniref:Glycosyltransferase 87 family protein n=1 Tax=Micromonospora zhanjiangensis TaxID=1522057 RepID=A0ABV8KKV4_9ACTN
MNPADSPAGDRPRRLRPSRLADGLGLDLLLYGLSAIFAGVTAATSTLLPHRAWGAVAAPGYLLATLAVLGQLLLRRHPDRRATLTGVPARAVLTVVTWATTAVLPMLWQAVERAAGRTDRAQEEVIVVEQAGSRLIDHGTPYLGHDAIAALPPGEQLLGYLPYQPGMALFGLPRALAGIAWWTDARVWFALFTAVVLAAAATLLWSHRAARPAVVRAVQLATVLPVCALTLATGGDDLPVLALCLLALSLCAAGRPGRAGLTIGLAAALKLFAWPVALVLLVHAATRGRRTAGRLAAGALGLPILAVLPALVIDPGALAENVVRFPLGHGLVTSPAQSPFPGHLIATAVPAGRTIAAALLVAAGVAIAVRLVRRPPRRVADTATICGYGLLAAILLMPSTRFGYLLYPVALLAWAYAVRRAEPRPEPTPRPPDPVTAAVR